MAKKHARAMKNVGESLMTAESMKVFFGKVRDTDYPEDCRTDFTDNVSAIDAFMDYTAFCGGDPHQTILKFAPPAPPLSPELGRRSTIKAISRDIASSPYATTWAGHGVAYTRMVCCWDDPNQGTTCIRGNNCPYLHVSTLIQAHPGAPDLFELIPCNFAGMSTPPGGCKWHRQRYASHGKWVVPPFEMVPEGAPPTVHFPPEGVGSEFAPTFDGTEWLLQPCGSSSQSPPPAVRLDEVVVDAARLEADIKDATQRFLDGFESDASGDDM